MRNPFSREPTQAEVKAFKAGKRTSGRAAVRHARNRAARGRGSLAAQSAAWKKQQKQQKQAGS